jgi:hypothetical protein
LLLSRARDEALVPRLVAQPSCASPGGAVTIPSNKPGWTSLRFVAYSFLGVVIGGYFGTIVTQTITDDSCLEEECAIGAIGLGLLLMIAGSVLGALLGFWTAWLHHRRR